MLRSDADSAEQIACKFDAASRLAGFGSEGRSLIRELLASETEWRQMLGGIAASRVGPDGYDDVIPPLVEAYGAHGDFWVEQALRGIKDPRVETAAMELLSMSESEDGRQLQFAISRVSDMGRRATSTLPRLRELASSHWSGFLRRLAANAYSGISGTAIAPALSRCPVAVRLDPPGAPWGTGTWTVTLHDAVVVLGSASAKPPAPPEGTCPRDDSPYGEFSLPVGSECLVARKGFECQGELFAWNGTKRTYIGPTAGGPLIRREEDVWALSFCHHMIGDWAVDALSRAPDGVWSRRRIASTPWSDVVAFAADESKVDLLVVDDEPCSGGAEPRYGVAQNSIYANVTFVLLHVDANGAVTVRD